MNLRSGNRLIICSEEQKKKKQRVTYLPDELIIAEILIRLPARTLAICSCVSKLWYNSIFHDPKFTSSHFTQNKSNLNIVFNLLNVFQKAYFLSIEEKKYSEFYYHRLLLDVSCADTNELVGYCNGLVCLKSVNKSEFAVINPTRGERLVFSNSTPAMGCKYLCHGFGFDSALQEYKAVFVYTTNVNEEEELVCMVMTLGGDNSWRKVVTSAARISSPPGSSPFPSRMKTRASMIIRRSATVCGGDLFWRITNTSNNNVYDMLLSFDIHNERIHFIRLPTECCLTHTKGITIDEHQCLVVDHHLLEFQGDLCVARTERILTRNCGDHHHQHRNHRCKGREGRFCCCGIKVHLYIMNDKVKQVWTRGETFDFPLKDGVLSDPFCCYFDNISFPTPPTRMLSYSDQLLLYWFDGLCLIIYSLQMKQLKVVECLSSRDERIRYIFLTKEKSVVRSPGRDVGYSGNNFFPYMDYQLHAQVENIMSLQNFIPKGLKISTLSQ